MRPTLPATVAPTVTAGGARRPRRATARAAAYTTAVRPGGVVGGPRAAALANEVREALRARGDEGEPDGALAAVRLVRGAGLRGRATRDGPRSRCARASRALVSTSAAFRLDAGADDVWRRALADIAANLPVTRYAVYVSPADVAVVVFGRMEVTLDPFQRRFRPGEACPLHGEISARYDHARVYLTSPDGKVDETPSPGRAIDVLLPLPGPGVYRVEVMSDGATGPVVLANVPLYVGVDDPPWAPPRHPTVSGPPSRRQRKHACSSC